MVVAPNWLGDAVMALPAIADVRRGRPVASIVVAAQPSVAPLFTLVGDVDEVVTLPKNGPYPLDGCDAALLLPNSFHSALMVARAGVPERWGYRTDWRAWLLTRAVPRAPAGLHQSAYYQQLVHSLGFPNGPTVPRLGLTPELSAAGAGILARAGWDGRMPLVALAPGAAFGSAKRWPPAAFADLAAGLADDGIGTVLLGSSADANTASDVMRALAQRATVFDLVGKTDLPTLSAVLVNCRALVANDSGTLHLAAALGVNVTAVFGPTDERTNAPLAEEARASSHEPRATSHVTVLTHPVWCRPCWLRECPLDHRCLRGIGVPRVLDATRRML